MTLVFKNAMTYNVAGPIHTAAKTLAAFYDNRWPQILAQRREKGLQETPASEALPPTQKEIRALVHEINHLSEAALNRLVDKVPALCPTACEQASHDELELNLDALCRKDFEELLAFAKSI